MPARTTVPACRTDTGSWWRATARTCRWSSRPPAQGCLGPGLGGIAGLGDGRGGLWGPGGYGDPWAAVNNRASAGTVAHELGHVMGLVHSARQGEAYHGAWRWSRGHYVSAFGERPRFGTIMTYGRDVLGGVFSDPQADCGGVACGVHANEPAGADAVSTLKILRFQVAAHRDPAADVDGDGIADAGDAVPDDPDEWLDTDGDGVGDNADPDDDNDGTDDAEDAFPFDPDEWADIDGDGIGDNADDDVRDLGPFRDPALRAVVEEALGKGDGAEITTEDMASLTELDGWNRGIRDLTGLESATGLEWLDLGGNDVDDLSPLSGLTALGSLYLSDNPVQDVFSAGRAESFANSTWTIRRWTSPTLPRCPISTRCGNWASAAWGFGTFRRSRGCRSSICRWGATRYWT